MNNKNSPVDIDRLMEQIRNELPHEPSHAAQTGTPQLSIGEIMVRVRGEVARRKAGPLAGVASATGQGAAFELWQPAAIRLAAKREYVLSDLLRFSDEDFIDVAYRILLRRSPDREGADHYLSLLRSGAATKVEILGILRWSPEGRMRDVHVDGLLVPYTLQRWRRKRFVGPVLSWLHAFVRLGVLSDRQAILDAAHAQEAQGAGRALNRISEQYEQQFAIISAAIQAQDIRIEALQQRFESTANIVQKMVTRERRAQEASRALDPLYAAFEDRFRGDRSLVRARSEPYLELIRETGAGTSEAPVIDIGCGRGEWLELLRDHSLVGRGIDLNHVFIEFCRSQGLDVIEGDAISTLRAMPDNSAGAITSMHLVEHLSFEDVIALLDEARRVLRPGGLILLETPNPENLSVASFWFYLDPTHRNPLPPEALKWIVEARGFDRASIERLTLAREIDAPALLPDAIPGAESINVVLASLNAAPDYAIVARRS